MTLIESLFILCMMLVLQVLFFILYNYRIKKDISKIVNTSVSENKKLFKSVHEYFLRLELRMAKPFAQFEKAHNDTIWIVVFTINRKQLLTETILSLKKSEPDINILVVDNGSTDGTYELLQTWINDNTIRKIVFNKKEDIPQWQKCFNIHQAFQLLASEKIDYIGWIDDDILIVKPWKQLVIDSLHELNSHNVRMVSLLNDDIQKQHHPPLSSVIINKQHGDIKGTINGGFVVFSTDILREFGLPPIREGINALGVEDWYYSRLLEASGYRCVAFDVSIHKGYTSSIREQLEKQQINT